MRDPTEPLPPGDEAQRIADAIRRRVLAHVLQNGGGYMSQACSSAEMLAALYGRILRLGPSEGPAIPPPVGGVPGPGRPGWPVGAAYNGPRGPALDRLFFSPVHYSLVLYAALIEVGRLAPGALEQFNRDGSTVEMIGAEHSPGIEVTAGSLGQALSVAGGVALARRLRAETGRVWVFMSDGEFQEGQTWEAFAAASFHGLDNLHVMVDVNRQQCDGPMETVMTIEPLAERLRSFGARAEWVDAHDVDALARAAALPHPGRPLVILGRSDPCRGLAPLRDRAPRLHYLRFTGPAERARYQAARDDWGRP